MMFSSPFFDGYDNDPRYYRSTHPPSRRRYLQQMRAAEEAERQRRAAARQQEYLRQVEEEEAYRQAYEAAKRRRQMEEARRVQQYLYGNSEYGDESEDESVEEEVVVEPVYRVMQGPYGQLYKVNVGERPQRSPPKPTHRRRSNTMQKPADVPQDEENHRLVRGSDGRIYRVELEEAAKKEEKNMQPKEKEAPSWFPRVNDDAQTGTGDEQDAVPMRIPIRSSFSSAARRRSSGKKKKVTVVVEDASDSESENEYKLTWRNRRPSPGEWMEPVNIA